MYPVYYNVPIPPITENTDLRQLAVIIGQSLADETIEKFKEEVRKSTLPEGVKSIIGREFYRGCNIRSQVTYMMNYHLDDIRIVGHVFDWILRNRELRKQRRGIKQ